MSFDKADDWVPRRFHYHCLALSDHTPSGSVQSSKHLDEERPNGAALPIEPTKSLLGVDILFYNNCNQTLP